jgi:hypothetical protein
VLLDGPLDQIDGLVALGTESVLVALADEVFIGAAVSIVA